LKKYCFQRISKTVVEYSIFFKSSHDRYPRYEWHDLTSLIGLVRRWCLCLASSCSTTIPSRHVVEYALDAAVLFSVFHAKQEQPLLPFENQFCLFLFVCNDGSTNESHSDSSAWLVPAEYAPVR
jgi:hypothetical protein